MHILNDEFRTAGADWDVSLTKNSGMQYLSGFNELQLKASATLVATVGPYPLLAVQHVGKGRTMARASDIGPHWCPELFVKWEGYARFWQQAIRWLAGSAE